MTVPSRRKQFERGEPEHPFGSWDLQVVLAVARLGVCTLPQVSRFLGWTNPNPAAWDRYRKARLHLRNSYDHEYLEKSGITRTQLAQEGGNHLLFGSAPHVYTLYPKGLGEIRKGKYLAEAEIFPTKEVDTKTMRIAHDLLVRDAHAWLAAAQLDNPGHRGLQEWLYEPACWVGTEGGRFGECRPDARFLYEMKERSIAGFLEIDRGTESLGKWRDEKIPQYSPLLSQEGEGSQVWRATGQKRARVVVVTVGNARRDWIRETLAYLLPGTDIPADRFWIAERSALDGGLADPVWVTPEDPTPQPLVPPDLL